MTLKDIKEQLRKLLDDGLVPSTKDIEEYVAIRLAELDAEAAMKSAEKLRSIERTSASTIAKPVRAFSANERRAPGRDSCRLLRDGVVVTRSKSSLSSLRLVKTPSKAGAGEDGSTAKSKRTTPE